MSEWKTVRLGDVCEIITGNTPSTKNEQYYSSKDIPFVKPSDLPSEFFSEIDSSEFYLSEDARSVSRIIPENCVLVSCIGIIGKTGITKREVAFNQQINALKPTHNQIDYKYLASAILSRKKYISEKANAAVVPIINKTDFSNLQIPLPPLETQKQIAAQLDKCTSLIAKHKQMLEKYDTLIKSRFIEMFGDPVKNPMGWKIDELANHFKVKGGKRIPKGMNYSTEITDHPYLRATDMKNATIMDDDIKYISEDVFQKIKNYTVKAGDIYLTNVGVNLGMAGVIPQKYDGANLTENAVKLVPINNNFNGEYISYYLNYEGTQRYINERKMTVGVPKLAIFRIETIPLIIPPLELQYKFATLVQQIDKSKFAVQKSLEKAETLYKSLMQEYFG